MKTQVIIVYHEDEENHKYFGPFNTVNGVSELSGSGITSTSKSFLNHPTGANTMNTQRILGHNSNVLGFSRLTPSQVRTSGRLTVLYRSRTTLEALLSSTDDEPVIYALTIALTKINTEIHTITNQE
jgi:hypothetical protein